MIHINYGHSADFNDDKEECWHCGKVPERVAYNYFGAPHCQECWDNWWLTTEDGASDPPFAEISNPVSGQWIDLRPTPTPPAAGESEVTT
jgi:hypothetical protein